MLCINALPIYQIILSIESKVSMYLVRNSKFGFAIGFTEISRVNEQNDTMKTFLGIENWFNCIFFYDLCCKFWFSRPTSNVLSPAFSWSKWVKWVTQGQELNISLWNWFHWIQCLRIGLRDIISYFYHQMLFLEVILLSTLSKMSNYMIKTSKLCLGSHLIGFSTLELY